MKVGDKLDCPRCNSPDAYVQYIDAWEIAYRCCECETSGGFVKPKTKEKEK